MTSSKNNPGDLDPIDFLSHLESEMLQGDCFVIQRGWEVLHKFAGQLFNAVNMKMEKGRLWTLQHIGFYLLASSNVVYACFVSYFCNSYLCFNCVFCC